MRRALVVLLAALLAAALLAGCRGGGGEPDSAGLELLERWLRLGEEEYASVEVYDRSVPPDLPGLLNPGADLETGTDLVALPVHPQGTLLGSFQIRRANGTHLVWLIFDVTADQSAAVDVLRLQLDEGPWQVISEQSDRSLGVIGFQSTRDVDVSGTAVAQPNPSAASYSLTVEREGREVTLSIPRGAPVPVIDATLSRTLEVTRVNPGAASRGGLQQGDRIVRVGDTPVETEAELGQALSAVGQGGAATTGVTYILEIRPPVTPPAPTFVLPAGRTLPDRFPGKDVWTSFTALDFQWFTSPQGSYYQTSLVSPQSPTAVADGLREALEDDGWLIVDDRPVGFATVLNFRHDADQLVGQASVDSFPSDEALTLVFVQIQTDTGAGN